MIGTCEFGHRHLLTDYSEVELLPVDNNQYKLVGTNIYNAAFPLIKYDTEDYVELLKGSCLCGRHFPLIGEIVGRGLDYIVATNGAKIFILCQITATVEGLISAQFLQEKLDEVIINVVVNKAPFESNGKAHLIKNAKDVFGQTMKIIVNQVSVIPRTSSGKQRIAISSC